MSHVSSSSSFPTRAQVVIVGGGVIGAAVAYHLAHLGWTDVVLVEQHQLTAGTTWHAAGLIVSGGMTTETLAWMAKYSRDLYAVLEDETGLSTGFRPVGYLQTASSEERLHKLAREADFLSLMGIEREFVSASEVGHLWPQLDTTSLLGGYFTENEGRADPANVCMSLAKGARQRGVRVLEGVRVTGVRVERGAVRGVDTDLGPVETEYVVNAAGMWARQLGALAGVNVPLQACEHAYLITQPIAGVTADLPIFEDPDRYAYYREETGGLMIGLFEPVSAPWSLDGIPDDFRFGEIPSDWDRLAPFLEVAMETLPDTANVGIRKLFTGPESFTPDNGFLIGEAPEVRNFFIAAGMNSLGVLTGAGAGSIVASWIVDGEPPVDVTDIDPARLSSFQANRSYLAERSVELLGRLHSTGSWPHSSPQRARGIRRSPVHHRLEDAGAHFVESSGWENAAWFAPPGFTHTSRLTYARHDWFDLHAEEHRAVREGVALFDLSAMSKFLIEGPDAVPALDAIAGNSLDVPVGRCVYTQLLDRRGRVLSDLTITRIGEQSLLAVVAEAFHTRTETLLRRGLAGRSAWLTDVTSGWALLSVQGPRSRSLLEQVTTADLSNDAFPYLTAQELDLRHARGYAFRMSFVGELGWELYVRSEFAVSVYDEIVGVGADVDLRLAGAETLESTRTEAGRRDYGLDMENTDTALEAGLGFAVDLDGSVDFVGKQALLAQRERRPLTRRLVQFLLRDPDPILHGEEPILLEGDPVGYLRSGAYGHTLGGAMGMGYVEHADGVTADLVRSQDFEILVAGERCPATASLRPMYDPNGVRVRM